MMFLSPLVILLEYGFIRDASSNKNVDGRPMNLFGSFYVFVQFFHLVREQNKLNLIESDSFILPKTIDLNRNPALELSAEEIDCMIQSVFRKALAVLVILLFVGCSTIPFLNNTSFQAVRITTTTRQSTSEGTTPHLDEDIRGRPDGLAPKTNRHQQETQKDAPFTNLVDYFAYNAYDPSGQHQNGPITFDTPDAIDLLAPGIFPNFCAGSDMRGLWDDWYGCDYAGGLYLIDTSTGSQTYIASTIGVNAMTYDGTTNTWYVSSSNILYIMDITNGQTTPIGSHNIGNIVIGLTCDDYGNLFAYDILWSGDSTLYSVNKETGECTPIGSMGYGFVYAQGCDYNGVTGSISIAGYFNDGSPSALLTCDPFTGEATIVANFAGCMEVDGLVAPVYCPPPHDISIQKINAPSSGNASGVTPEVGVLNSGYFVENNVSINFLIGKEQINGTIENFEATNGSYIHFAKNTDSWQYGAPTSGPGDAHSGSNLWATILTDNYPTNMWSGLMTPPFIVPTGMMFTFWHWYQFETGWDGGNLKISTDGGTTFTLITPVGGYPGTLSSNPYMTGQPGYTGTGETIWAQAVFDLTAYEGMTVIILWETASDSSIQYAGWYIDDVGFTQTSWVTEYNQTVTIPVFEQDEHINVTFPEWIPADLGSEESVTINYKAEAINLHDDGNPYNDYKEKDFTLYFGYFHDVAITQIVSPVDGLAATQTPEVIIENHGQNAETVEVEMTIGKAVYTTLLEEDFAGGVPPAGWGTNYPSNWYGSSTNYAGGVAPEAIFSWTPSSVDEHYLWTGAIDTTGFTALSLRFKEYVNDYNGDYTLKVVTSVDGGSTWSDAYVRAGGPYGPATTEITLTAANGIGSATFMIAWDMSGDSFNINYWYIDNVWMGIIDMVEEYNETVSDIGVLPGETINVSLPDWTPSDIPFATTIDYLITADVSLNLPDEEPSDNELAKTITLHYEHDVGVVEITEPVKADPGEYPVEGIIQNFGVTFSEIDIPVNAQFINDTGVIFYNETMIVPGPLAPGAQTIVTFPNVTFPENPGHYYSIKLTMMTQLANDDHPENNKKTKTWSWDLDIYPPNTTATVSGAMGHNDWFISSVQVTLTATDNKGWPSGVNNTFYKVDTGDWFEYITPIIVDIDGQHTVYFYSDDNCIPPNVEEIQEVSFKMDTTEPVFLNYTFTSLNFMQDEWLCSATVEDATSGVTTVEFYVDDVLIGEDDEPPFECLFNGKPTNNSQGLAYDAAGNSAFSPLVYSSEMTVQQQRFLRFSSIYWGGASILPR